ncbi:MMPL family transporter [Crenobacter sp. SG2305]|uniref:MMPL family transporter n=1 Tax=Crenobacter oryzisoli TaxID=3056844 RepID=UPI0025AB0DC7|nr:MMPL family transporter [Crenobacter sp. SG2305]MDN0081914.1 MMPL family transporter [Crenobacter sp. SG2305]
MKSRHNKLALFVWLAVMLASVLVIAQTRFVADLSAFMPKVPSARQQMLIDQLRDGAIARIVLVGIEGGDEAERGRLSRLLVSRLAHNPRFTSVQNGDSKTQQRDQLYFFNNRYLLSPAVTPERFSVAGLRTAIQDTLDAMSGDVGLVVKKILPRDPTGETLQIVDQFIGESQPRSSNDIWVSRDGKRAVLLLQLAESGLNTDAQATALDDVRQAFASLPQRHADTQLVMSGTSVMSVASRDTIKSEVERLATLGTVLVVALLLLVYRSLPLLLLGLIPVVSGALVGIASVSLGFGHVHGLTLGFGTTLIGEAVDYSIYLFIQRAGGNEPGHFWRTIRLGVLTSIAGFAALMCSSFPGLSQLGLYSISGLVTAALVTRYILPGLMPARLNLRDLSGPGLMLQKGLDFLTRMRWVMAVVLLAAVAVLVFHQQDIWSRQLNALSSISKEQNKLDAELRGDLGGNDMRYVASFSAPDQESALQLAERSRRVLQDLVRQRVIGGFHTPDELLPSQASQRARQAALPTVVEARQRLVQALDGMPLQADRLEDFLADVERSRAQPLLSRQSLQGSAANVLLDSMLIKRPNGYLVLMPLQPIGEGAKGGEIALDKVRATLERQQLGQVTVIDLLEETTAIFDSYTHEALVFSSLGSLAILLLLGFTCGWMQAVRVTIPLGCAVLCVVAIFDACGIQLTILHLVGLLLVVAIGSNYALFFANKQQLGSEAEQRQVEVSLVVANLATVTSFGLLGTSSVPVLSFIGSTVAIGALLALVFSAMMARIRPRTHHS